VRWHITGMGPISSPGAGRRLRPLRTQRSYFLRDSSSDSTPYASETLINMALPAALSSSDLSPSLSGWYSSDIL